MGTKLRHKDITFKHRDYYPAYVACTNSSDTGGAQGNWEVGDNGSGETAVDESRSDTATSVALYHTDSFRYSRTLLLVRTAK